MGNKKKRNEDRGKHRRESERTSMEKEKNKRTERED